MQISYLNFEGTLKKHSSCLFLCICLIFVDRIIILYRVNLQHTPGMGVGEDRVGKWKNKNECYSCTVRYSIAVLGFSCGYVC